jgi:hypothetical protein
VIEKPKAAKAGRQRAQKLAAPLTPTKTTPSELKDRAKFRTATNGAEELQAKFSKYPQSRSHDLVKEERGG